MVFATYTNRNYFELFSYATFGNLTTLNSMLTLCSTLCCFFLKKQEEAKGILNYGAFCYSTLVQYTRETNTFSETSCKTSCRLFDFLMISWLWPSCKCGTKVWYEKNTHHFSFVVFVFGVCRWYFWFWDRRDGCGG